MIRGFHLGMDQPVLDKRLTRLQSPVYIHPGSEDIGFSDYLRLTSCQWRMLVTYMIRSSCRRTFHVIWIMT